jgi:hypothetical protein
VVTFSGQGAVKSSSERWQAGLDGFDGSLTLLYYYFCLFSSFFFMLNHYCSWNLYGSTIGGAWDRRDCLASWRQLRSVQKLKKQRHTVPCPSTPSDFGRRPLAIFRAYRRRRSMEAPHRSTNVVSTLRFKERNKKPKKPQKGSSTTAQWAIENSEDDVPHSSPSRLKLLLDKLKMELGLRWARF